METLLQEEIRLKEDFLSQLQYHSPSHCQNKIVELLENPQIHTYLEAFEDVKKYYPSDPSLQSLLHILHFFTYGSLQNTSHYNVALHEFTPKMLQKIQRLSLLRLAQSKPTLTILEIQTALSLHTSSSTVLFVLNCVQSSLLDAIIDERSQLVIVVRALPLENDSEERQEGKG